MKRGKNSYLSRAYQLLQAGKSIKQIGIEEFGFPEKTAKQNMNYYISDLKELKYIENVGYGVWEIKKEWNQEEVDNFLKQVKKTTRIGINQLEEVKNLKEVRGHAVQIKLELPENYRNWENRRKIFDLIGLEFEDHFIGGQLRGELAEIDKIKIHFYRKTILVNFDEKSFIAETAKKSRSYALVAFLRIIKKLERMFNNSPLSQFGKYKFKITRQHYALMKNALARQYINEKKKLEVYTGRGLWLLIDDSFNLEELETVHPDTAVEDNGQVQEHFNNIKETPLEVVKELKPLTIKSALIESSNQIKVLAENQQKSHDDIQVFGREIRTHIPVYDGMRLEVRGVKNTNLELIKLVKALTKKLEKKL
jgi:hypothetical protein